MAAQCYERKQQQHQQNESLLSKADIAMAKFYEHYQTDSLPEWVDMNQIVRGQQLFIAYGWAFSLALNYRSLAPGFFIPKNTAVINATGYLAPPANHISIRNRLLDTGAFMRAIMSDNGESLQPLTGEGWKAALQVRILHAKVRHALLKRKEKTRKWDKEKFGVPIDQEVMAATLLGFASNSLMGYEIILGFPFAIKDQLDFLAFWQYVGSLLGVEFEEKEYLHKINNLRKQSDFNPQCN